MHDRCLHNIFDFFYLVKKFNGQRPDYNKYSPKLNTYSAIERALGIGSKNYPYYRKRGFIPLRAEDIYLRLSEKNIIPKNNMKWLRELVTYVHTEVNSHDRALSGSHDSFYKFIHILQDFYEKKEDEKYIKHVIMYLDNPQQYAIETETIWHHIPESNNVNSVRKNRAQYLTRLPKAAFKLIGREKEMSDIEHDLSENHRVLLVSGLGGIGKTEICKAYIHDHVRKGSYSYIGWINYISSFKESIVSQMNGHPVLFNEQDTLDEKYEKIMFFLQSIHEESLLIIDNIVDKDDESLWDMSAIPFFKIIANSRCQFNELKRLEGFHQYVLDFLEMKDCLDLFYTIYEGEKDNEILEKIIELAGNHTLTIELLAKTAYYSGVTIKELYNGILALGFNLGSMINAQVKTSWHDMKKTETIFNHLLKLFSLSRVSEEEKEILMHLSVLPPVDINERELLKWLNLPNASLMHTIIEKGWVKRIGFGKITMHPLIQETTRYSLKPDAGKCHHFIQAIAGELFYSGHDNPYDKVKYTALGDSLLKYLNEDTQSIGLLYNNLSTIYRVCGQRSKALDYQLKATQIRAKVLGENHPDLATSLCNLSVIYTEMGKSDLALKHALDALAIRQEAFDENHPDIATSYFNLSSIYVEMGKFDESLDYQLKAIAIREAVFDKNHPDLSLCYNDMAYIYSAMGDLDKGLHFQLKSLHIMEEVFDRYHPELSVAYNNLSIIYRHGGNMEKCLSYQLKSIQIVEKICDQYHPERASSYSNLSMIYNAVDQYDKALDYQLKAMEIQYHSLSENHPNTAIIHNNLSIIYRNIGEFDKALEHQLKAIHIAETLYPKANLQLANFYSNLSIVYRKVGQYQNALDYQLKDIDIKAKMIDEYHHDFADSYENLSCIYRLIDKVDKALEYQLKTIAIREKIFKKDHPELIKAYKVLSEINQ